MEKSKFLKDMLIYELDLNQENLSCEVYPYKTELKFFVYHVATELKEVIEIFNGSTFLGGSKETTDSDKNS